MSNSEIETILARSEGEIESEEVSLIVRNIIDDVSKNGDAAVLKWTNKLDGCELTLNELIVSEEEVQEAILGIDQSIIDALIFACDNVEAFHKNQIPLDFEVSLPNGAIAGTKYLPIENVALYVPRGKGSFPSVLYMLAIPALLAGVKNITICTPPSKEGTVDPLCLFLYKYFIEKYDASITLVKSGGAQVVAALAFGTEKISKCDKIVGPGNIYVSSAKRILSRYIDPGAPAGPSESLIISDRRQDEKAVAFELVNEAEHGPDSAALLLTDDIIFANKVRKLAIEIIEKLPQPRLDFCKTVFSKYGGIIVFDSIDSAIDFSNSYGPEHLRVLTDNQDEIVGRLTNTGEILIGRNCAISMGNFAIGVNAILPTGNQSRVASSVGVDTFIKRQSWASVEDNKSAKNIASVAALLADHEGFPAHKMAAEYIQWINNECL